MKKQMKFLGMITAFVACVAAVVLSPIPEASAFDVPNTPANASYLVLPDVTTAITNGQVISVTNSFTLLSNDGLAVTVTTNTLAAPSHDGLVAVIQVANGQTNQTKINAGSTAVLTGPYTGTEGGAPLVLFSANSLWYEVQNGPAGLTSTQKVLTATGTTNSLVIIDGRITAVN